MLLTGNVLWLAVRRSTGAAPPPPDTTATAAEHADSPEKQPRLSADAKWIVATGVALGLLLITLISTMLLQNATIHARIDDTNANMRDMRTELRTEMQELRTEMHSMRADLQAEIRERHAETQTDIREVRTEMREMRSLLLQILERTAPANPVN